MTKVKISERLENVASEFFNGQGFAPPQPLAARQNANLLVDAAPDEDSFLDSFLTVIKWTFLYLPGAATIHFIMFGFALLVLHRDWGGEMMLGTLGFFAVAVFMMMIGIGKLGDLKYLKVVAAVSLTSMLATISYLTLAGFMPGDFFGFFALISLPLTAAVGYFVKKNIDRSTDVN